MFLISVLRIVINVYYLTMALHFRNPKLYFYDTNRVCKARYVEVIREHLVKAENSGFISQSSNSLTCGCPRKFSGLADRP